MTRCCAMVLLLACLVACDREGEGAAEQVSADGCRWPPLADTVGWQVVDAGPFVFKVPPAYREQVVAGVDTNVGIWLAGHRAISFDYGPATMDPRERADTAAGRGWTCETTLAGRRAVVHAGEREVRPAPGRTQRHDVAEGWWPEVPGDSARLLVIGWGPPADSAGRREVLTVVRTVKFRTALNAQDLLRQTHRFCRNLAAQAERGPEFRARYEEWRPRCPTGDPPPPPDYDAVR